MIYNQFQDMKLSALGMGCMRLPVGEGGNSDIDMQATREMVAYAMEKGINYYDTAWGYHEGHSETVMGEVLSEYPRDSFYLASKFPGYDLANFERIEEIFEKQLEKCRVDHFDFYLFHSLGEKNIDAYLDPKYGLYEYLMKQKASGRIRHLGFSAHASLEVMKRFLDAYGKDLEFCQLQINWMDWHYQNAKEKVKLVSSYGIPVWVMEPVRGGSLANLEPAYAEELKALRPRATAAEWAFRFVQSLPEVKMTLSGMSNFAQLKENIETYDHAEPVSEDEMRTLFRIARKMTGKDTLPCTACRYCTAHCPMELDIPRIIELYNEHIYSDGRFTSRPEGNQPADCIGCRACEAVCPQEIKISEMMTDFAQKL